jgi:hypothetical protein
MRELNTQNNVDNVTLLVTFAIGQQMDSWQKPILLHKP